MGRAVRLLEIGTGRSPLSWAWHLVAPASISGWPWSRRFHSGWNPNPRLDVGAACSFSEWALTRVVSTSITTGRGVHLVVGRVLAGRRPPPRPAAQRGRRSPRARHGRPGSVSTARHPTQSPRRRGGCRDRRLAAGPFENLRSAEATDRSIPEGRHADDAGEESGPGEAGLEKSEQFMLTDEAADAMEPDDMYPDTVRVLVEP
jgi:hypothetical protein